MPTLDVLDDHWETFGFAVIRWVRGLNSTLLEFQPQRECCPGLHPGYLLNVVCPAG